MDASLFTSMLFATVVAGTPLIIVALGLLVNEKAGVLNLGAEGMMAMGAVAAFAVTHESGNPWLGVAAGMGAGMAMAALFGVLVLTLMANQVASGLALAIFGVGLAAFVGKPYEAVALQAVPPIRIPFIADLPLIGEALYNQQALVYFSWALFWGLLWFLHRSRAGLVLRAVGESPASAHAIGYPVIRIRYLAVLFGGAMAGIGGAFLSVFYTPMWAEGMVAGRGGGRRGLRRGRVIGVQGKARSSAAESHSRPQKRAASQIGHLCSPTVVIELRDEAGIGFQRHSGPRRPSRRQRDLLGPRHESQSHRPNAGRPGDSGVGWAPPTKAHQRSPAVPLLESLADIPQGPDRSRSVMSGDTKHRPRFAAGDQRWAVPTLRTMEGITIAATSRGADGQPAAIARFCGSAEDPHRGPGDNGRWPR